MKIRSGFVSNSSSSSFIIATNATSSKKSVKITMEVDISHLIGEAFYSISELHAYYDKERKNEQEYTSIKLETLGDYLEYAGIEDIYYRMKKTILEEKVVYLLGASNEDGDAISQYIHDNGFPDNVEGIEVLENYS